MQFKADKPLNMLQNIANKIIEGWAGRPNIFGKDFDFKILY